ncbi:MAG: hypothetical protein JOZ87_16045 [Chloroflexi bacterium]|nr:hypothetical protein [Chloroflexota bacterium]
MTYNGRPLYLYYNDAYIPGLAYNNGMASINGAGAHTRGACSTRSRRCPRSDTNRYQDSRSTLSL